MQDLPALDEHKRAAILSAIDQRYGLNSSKEAIIKTLATVVASTLFLTKQMGITNPTASIFSFMIGTVTFICEKTLRQNPFRTTHWFCEKTKGYNNLYSHYSTKTLASSTYFQRLKTALLTILSCYTLIRVFTQQDHPQAVLKNLSTLPTSFILYACTAAPIVEEILFRGFLQERIEDLIYLTDRHLISLTKNKKRAIIAQTINDWLQPVIFGGVHITGNQVPALLDKIFIFSLLTALGKHLSTLKKNSNSLLKPCTLHLRQNIVAFSMAFLQHYFNVDS